MEVVVVVVVVVLLPTKTDGGNHAMYEVEQVLPSTSCMAYP